MSIPGTMNKLINIVQILLLPLLSLLPYHLMALNIADQLLPNSIKENDLFLTKILRGDNEQYLVEVTTKDLTIKDTYLWGEKFSYVYSKDCHVGDIAGNPALPIYTQCIALPTNSDRLQSATVEELEWDTIKVGRLMPLQPSLREGEAPKELFMNRSVYEDGWYNPILIQTTDIQIFRGIKNTNVRVCPFKYNALSGELAVLRRFQLKILFTQNKAMTKVLAIPSRFNSLFDNIAAPSNSLATSMRSYVGNYDYLIIVGDIPNVLNSDILKEFRMWKALRGIRTRVVTTDSIGCLDTNIKSFIQSQYASDSIMYVLFIGKAHHIPQHMMSQFVHTNKILRSDYWYGCMDGENDWDADIAVGRYSVNSLQELENAMMKTIKYEVGTNAEGKKVLLVADQTKAELSNSFQNCLEAIRTNGDNSNYSFVKEYGATVENGGTGATSASVAGRINQEVGIFNYRGHAGPFFWKGTWSWLSRPLFDSLMVSTFTNEKYPIALSIACETGRIDSLGTCLMDLYMIGEHGISSGLGTTIESWHDQNNTYNKNLYTMINSENDGLGFINIGAHKMCMCNPSNNYKDNLFSYCCFGDPSLRVWTDSIKVFPEPTLEVISNSLSISVGSITDYDIIIASETDGLIAKYHSTSSSYSIPLPSVSCTIALHKNNYESYLFDYIATGYVQNKDIKRRTFASVSPIAIGHHVTSEIPDGNVIIKKGGLLQTRQNSEVIIPSGFECQLGGQLIIK